MKAIVSPLFLLLFVVVSPLLLNTAGAECVSYEKYYHPLDSHLLLNFPHDMVKNGSSIYITGEQQEMTILDVSDPEDIQALGAYPLANGARDVAVKGSVAFLLLPVRTLQLVDVTDPESPFSLGSCELPATPNSIALAGTFAYITAWDYGEPDNGVYIVDISNPQFPSLAAWIELDYYPNNIVVDGDYAYVLDSVSLHIIDISSPLSPVIVGSLTFAGEQRFLTKRGDYIYVVCQAQEWPPTGNGLYVVNCSNPDDPWIEGQLTVEEAPSGPICLWEQYAVIGYGDGCAFVDISDPAAPIFSWHTGGQGYPAELLTSDSILYNCAYGIFGTYELHQQFTPEIVAEVPNTENSRYMRTRGNYAYAVQTMKNRLNVISASDPENPVLIGSAQMGYERAFGIALTENITRIPYAFVGGQGETNGFSIVDISDPANPEVAGTVDLEFDIGEFDIEGNYLYMPAEYGEVHIYDITDPLAPVFTDSMEFTFSFDYIKVIGSTMYIGRKTLHHSSIWIVDVSDPWNPVLLGESSLPRKPYEFRIDEPNIYIADHDGGFLILDAKYPTDIQQVSRLRTTRHAQSLELVGDYAYLADTENGSGIQVIDISNPYIPVVVGNCQVTYPYELIHINGHLLAGCMHHPLAVIPLICEVAEVVDTEQMIFAAAALEIVENPSLGQTEIKLNLHHPQTVELTVHDIQGRIVQRLYRGGLNAGIHHIEWDGRGRNGNGVQAGVYFAGLKTDRLERTSRILLLR